MSEQKFMVLLAGKFPVKFHSNVRGRVYSVVANEEATLFDDAEEAGARARAHGMAAGDYQVWQCMPEMAVAE